MTTSNESNSGFGRSKEEMILPRAAKESDLEDIDKDWIKEIYFPDLPGDESPEFLLKYHFECAGYAIKRIETAPSHPVIIVRAVRTTAPRIAEYEAYFSHLRDVVHRAGFRLRKDELTVDQKGAQILVAFQSGKPAADFMQILQEPQEDFADGLEILRDQQTTTATEVR
jgi:hypothetical protein